MENKDDKSALLNKLQFEREEEIENTTLSWTAIVVLLVLSLGMGGFASYWLFVPAQSPTIGADEISSEQDTPSSDAVSEIETPVVENKIPASAAILNASGYITARRMATVSAQTMGLIENVFVEEGMKVKQGQVLAKLDDTIAKVNLEQAKANVKTLDAQLQSQMASLQEAQRQYQRVFNNQYSSQAEKTQAETAKETAKAAVAQSHASLDAARIEVKKQQELLDHYTITAPFGGVVTMKNAQPGEIVAPSSAGGGFTRTGICTIVDMDSLEIEVDVNESFIGRVYAGQKVEAHLDAYPDWSIPASVIAIIPTADRGKATVSVRIKIEIKDAKILPDMGVKVAFLK